MVLISACVTVGGVDVVLSVTRKIRVVVIVRVRSTRVDVSEMVDMLVETIIYVASV